MTTAAWDGDILAADSMGSIPSVTSHCPNCNKEHPFQTIDRDKIVCYVKADKPPVYRNQEIEYLVCAGRSPTNKAFTKAIESNFPPEMFLKSLAMISNELDIPPFPWAFQFLIITKTEWHLFNARKSDRKAAFEVITKPRSEKIAIGSGHDTAKIMLSLGLAAPDAVNAAAINDKHTGGPIHFYDTREETPAIRMFLDEAGKALSGEDRMMFLKNALQYAVGAPPAKPKSSTRKATNGSAGNKV